ncbi:MAG: alpha-mannosidase [Clostridiales bacterium]|nr:alpha-mannosidase [Clostridiales bacterium]
MPYYKRHMQDQINRAIVETKHRVYTVVEPLTVEAFRTDEPVPYAERASGERITPAFGEKWGKLWDCAWFHATGTVPDACAGKEVVLKIDISGEACVFNEKGEPVKGLTTFTVMWEAAPGSSGKRIYKFLKEAKGGEPVDIWFDAGNNDLFGNEQGSMLRDCHICTLNENIRQLYYDFMVLNDLLRCLPEKSSRRERVFFKLYKAACLLKSYSDEEVLAARAVLKEELDKKGGDPSVKVTAIGHSHMDLAWLWPIRETKRKVARTFATVLELMERYPDYRYGASQPQQYEWVKELHPQMYEDIKKRVKEGRWELQGGAWVEADANVPSGESLVRQLLYGKRFFKQEFGQEVDNYWLPDVFGYSAALPQILKKSGVDYFMTQKLSWNEHNRFPHHTFNWEGIDGTKVLAHMLPEDTYNGAATPCGVHKIDADYLDSGVCDEALMLFGIGDGGGGPAPAHLEQLDRMKDLNGLLPVEQGFAADFFHRIAGNMADYITYKGELYLEKHQGTYTTQANNKKYNRLMELNLHELEFAAVLAAEVEETAYPREEIDAIWKEMLLYQFHDILPGSSIKRVYDESVPRYRALLARVRELTDGYYQRFAAAVGAPAGAVIAFNSTSYQRQEWVQTKNGPVRVAVPPMGYAVAEGTAAPVRDLTAGALSIESDKVKVVFNEDGSIASVYDKALGRNVLAEGSRGNVLALYEDKGDCWDIPITYRDKAPDQFKLVSQKAYIDESIPAAVMEQAYAYGNSTLTQKIRIQSGEGRVDFVTHADWHENELMLRASFQTAVLTDQAACNIQFGKLYRSAVNRTSQDMAQFEICCHQYVDLSEADFGVALLNNCKYGHYVKDGMLDINLLRSQNHPGKEADRGEHDFTYSIYSHAGNEIQGGVTKEARRLNQPLKLYTLPGGGGLEPSASLFSVDRENVVVDTVKFAEDSRDIILRVYEAEGMRGKARIFLPAGIKKAVLTNLMEEEDRPLELSKGCVTLDFGPYTIHTIKLVK